MKSLYSKFLVFTAGTMLVSTLIAFLVVNTFYHQQLKPKNDAKNMGIARQIAMYVESTENLQLEKFFKLQADSGYKFYVVNEQGVASFYGTPFREENLSPIVVEHVLSGESYHGMRDFKTETFVTGFFADELTNTVGVPFTYEDLQYALFMRPDIQFLFTEIHYLLGGMVIIMALVSLSAMLMIAKKLIDPIQKLTIATKKVGEEQFSFRQSLPVDRKDEIGQLAHSFQQMIQKLCENDRIRKEFISDVSHDFQSPLLNIKGYATLLMEENTAEDQKKHYLKVIQSETERLSILTKQLLLLNSLDQLESPLQKKRFRLDKQLHELIQRYRWMLEDKQLSLTMEFDTVEINGDPSFLEKVWENLLTNAIKYTPEGGQIEVLLREEENQVYVMIRDNGIGIASEHQKRIFDRFYRADQSRTKEIEGTGLGLPIVEQVVQLHDGSIQLESEEGKGTTFHVFIPKL